MSIIETLVEKFPVRKSGAQKAAFREWFCLWAKEQGYEAQTQTERMIVRCNNVVVGDPEKAEVVFTAHYDTPAVMPLPNFITPCNVLVWLLYQIVMSAVILAPGIILGACAGWLGGYISNEAGFVIGYFATLILMFITLALMMAGPANKNCVNDNTSGVAAVMELMQRLPQEQRGKVAFILFDYEEMGLLGSSAYASKHKNVKTNKLLINMDCVGDGEHMMFFANKKTRALPCFPALEKAMQQAQGRQFHMNMMEKCVYPSDQANYKLGIAVCACNYGKVVGYYCDKIHTKKDTICEQVNLDFLTDGLTSFVETL